MDGEKSYQSSRGVERRDKGSEEDKSKKRRDGRRDERRDKEKREAETRRELVNPEPRKEIRRTSQSVETGHDRPHSSVDNGHKRGQVNSGGRSSAPAPSHDSRSSARRVEKPPTTIVDNSSLPIRRRDHSSNRGPNGSDTVSGQRRGRGDISKDIPTQSKDERVTVPPPIRRDRPQDSRPGRRDPSVHREIEKLKVSDSKTSKSAATDNHEKRSRDESAPKIPTSSPHNKVRVGVLPKCYRPCNDGKDRRLIVFGDVHGMPDAKNRLLSWIKYDPALDHQIFGGDMITKGRKSKPSKNATTKELITIEASKDVVRQARRDGASGVRGNHEDCVLNVKHERNGWEEPIVREMDNQFNIKARKKLRTPDHRDTSDYDLYDALTTEERHWLEDLPDILVLGKCGGRNNMVVVHAGLNPLLDLKDQRVIETMNIKSIDPVRGYTSSMHEGDKERKNLDEEDKKRFKKMEPWFEVWEDKQDELPSNKRTTVMYGHESKKGLTKKKFSIGLDTGAQRINKLNPDEYRTLTALLIYHDKCTIIQVKEIKKKTGKWEWEPVELTQEESNF
ncbi:hypothetical protein BOTCAL_0158g00250 [Botryotinia calthae]|uniref:Calcineurin-like phosphoesterase domain-containing protein n=1 Tax=Botryotinia calthae TaxID=38488 RepID=A0A4Y8D201_9HELO|nr:hypothetical protein BOTCAL_0158g00250 [Botryotinia calthae]